MLCNVLAVACGGALGAVARYLLGLAVGALGSQASIWGAFPLSTFLANALGCFLIGMLSVAFDGPLAERSELRLFAITGLMGGFTTFSTFGLETVSLFQDGAWGLAAFNALASLAVCIACVVVGRLIGAALLAR